MINSKVLEIRDSLTFIPVLAVQMKATGMSEEEQIQAYYIHWRAGYSRDGNTCVLIKLTTGEAHNDAYSWGSGNRTMLTSHLFIEANFDTLRNGDVIDVEFILGETTQAKKSERFTTRKYETLA